MKQNRFSTNFTSHAGELYVLFFAESEYTVGILIQLIAIAAIIYKILDIS